jgi:hypothetical protein
MQTGHRSQLLPRKTCPVRSIKVNPLNALSNIYTANQSRMEDNMIFIKSRDNLRLLRNTSQNAFKNGPYYAGQVA